MDKSLKSYTLHNYCSIPQMASLPANISNDINIVGQVLPFKSNNYVVDELIDWSDIENDPIFTLNFPRKEML